MLSKDERTLLYADKLGFGDEDLQPMNRSDLDNLTDAIEAALLAKLREGGVELPEPDRNCEQAAFEDWVLKICPSGDVTDVNDAWKGSSAYDELGSGPCYTEAQLLDYGDRRVAAAVPQIWVLTREYNDYDQHGEYFVHAWPHKPTAEDLKAVGVGGHETVHVLAGGGRVSDEYTWYLLSEVSTEAT